MDKTEAVKNLLTRGAEKIVERDHLLKALLNGAKLRVKYGIDPTGPKIHIGRALPIWKLREFQDLGHDIVIIIGDFTAQIGDPSDKLAKRPFLSPAQVKANMKDYAKQLGMILDIKKVELRKNSEWLGKFDLREMDELADLFSAQQMLARRNFKERWGRGEEISIREMHYPMYQGYDSVAVKADVEIGGSDQLFNLMAGRKIQEHYGQKPQDVLITKMLLGLDGRKMSTSWGNVINIANEPGEQYGKAMSMNDELIPQYFELATNVPMARVEQYIKPLKNGANPKEIKQTLAFEIVKRYHGEAAARKAAENFDKLFSRKDISGGDLPELAVAGKEMPAADLVLKSGAVKSKNEARRLVEQGGLAVEKEIIKNPARTLRLSRGVVVKIGKRHFFRAR